MLYTVDGRGPDDPGFHRNVGLAIMKHSRASSRQRKRQAKILSVDYQWQADNFELLFGGWGKGSTDFYFLMMSLLKHASPSISASSLLA